MEDLCCKIENLRQKMHVTALEKGISHPEVLKISSELDEVLNEFYKLSLAKKTERYEEKSEAPLGYRLNPYPVACKYRRDRISRLIGQTVSNI